MNNINILNIPFCISQIQHEFEFDLSKEHFLSAFYFDMGFAMSKGFSRSEYFNLYQSNKLLPTHVREGLISAIKFIYCE